MFNASPYRKWCLLQKNYKALLPCCTCRLLWAASIPSTILSHAESLCEPRPNSLQVCVPLPAWGIRAGARETIYFNPAETNVAIVTCGGLCPGLNDVVQGLVRKLEDYGVPEGNILGIR